MTNITNVLNGYEISKTINDKGVVVWTLKGKRGAHYTSLRNAKQNNYLFFVGRGQFGGAMKFGNYLWFTDSTGELKLA